MTASASATSETSSHSTFAAVCSRHFLVQRVVLLDFDKATNRISFRHFSIVVQPCGVTKSVKTLIGKRKVPDLGTFQDVAEFLTKSGYGSVSPPPPPMAIFHLRNARG